MDWGSYSIFIAKTAATKIGALFRFMKLVSPEVAFYLYKSTILPCREYSIIMSEQLLIVSALIC